MTRAVLVTGGNRGIGLAIVRKLAELAIPLPPIEPAHQLLHAKS
jgi:NADP-dependent 3-hydroxy acid dehydrogenase YdfG